jgi:UDP-N-acetylmuramyl tripeptide synthase
MMQAAIANASDIIFTTDNSRSEDFGSILEDALEGNKEEKIIPIEDRREAIIYGSRLVGNDDCLVILGKGHEETQEISGKTNFFSDHEVVNEIYK